MPNTSNFGFDYESPTSLPGTTLTGGPTNTLPILAIQVDSALQALTGTVETLSLQVADNVIQIAANRVSLGNLTNWSRRGTSLVNFTLQDSFTVPVVFGFTFPAAPTVTTNIDSGAGATGRWDSRAISITTTGFTLFVFSNAAGSTNTWVDIPVSYIALYRA